MPQWMPERVIWCCMKRGGTRATCHVPLYSVCYRRRNRRFNEGPGSPDFLRQCVRPETDCQCLPKGSRKARLLHLHTAYRATAWWAPLPGTKTGVRHARFSG